MTKKYTNSYLEADKHLRGGLYDFLMDCEENRLSYQEVTMALHDKGYDTTDETVRKWLRMLLSDDGSA